MISSCVLEVDKRDAASLPVIHLVLCIYKELLDEDVIYTGIHFNVLLFYKKVHSELLLIFRYNLYSSIPPDEYQHMEYLNLRANWIFFFMRVVFSYIFQALTK